MRFALAVVAFISFAALAQQPRIDSISPAQGPIAGVTPITVSGTNFGGGTVRLDRTPITPTSRTDSELKLQMPPHDNGYVVISVENASGTAYGEFLYVPPRLRDLPAGSITTVAGVGNYVRTFGPANRVTVLPVSIAYGSKANLYMTEAGPSPLRSWMTTWTWRSAPTAIFSSGTFACGGSMPTETCRRSPAAQTGVVTTFAGNGGPVNGIEGYGHGTYCGDGGPAIDACLNTPYGIDFDADGSMYVSEQWQRIRRIAPNGTITTFASGIGGISKIVFGPGGYLYGVGQTAGRYDRNGIFESLAGTDVPGFAGDGGLAIHARINSGGQAAGVAIDSEGNSIFRTRRTGAFGPSVTVQSLPRRTPAWLPPRSEA
jgi:hypothetical protein